jgi:hypothetical protein
LFRYDVASTGGRVEWWQVVLIIGGAVAVGLGAGYVLNLVAARAASAFRISRRRPVRQRSLTSVRQSQTEPPGPVEPPMISAPPAPPVPSVPDLFAEIEHNRRLAADQWSGQLEPFQTTVWDNRGDEVHSLPADIRNALVEAYSDMALANSITWLSTEMSRRSPSLDESYTKLRASIAARLGNVRLQLTELSSPARSVSPK